MANMKRLTLCFEDEVGATGDELCEDITNIFDDTDAEEVEIETQFTLSDGTDVIVFKLWYGLDDPVGYEVVGDATSTPVKTGYTSPDFVEGVKGYRLQ